MANKMVPIDEAVALALAWNGNNKPPLSEQEVLNTVHSIYSTHAQNHPNDDINLNEVLQRGSEIMKLDLETDWLVANLIPMQSIILLCGRGGIGKTWLMLQIADVISKGEPFLGYRTKRVPVVYVDFENSLPVLKERLEILDAGEILFWHNSNCVPPPRLDKKQWELYKKLPANTLIIFDTLRASQGKDENDSRQMAEIMMRLKELRDIGYTIVLLHHTPKRKPGNYKGSTAILDLADHVLIFEEEKINNSSTNESINGIKLRLGTKEKTRYTPYAISVRFIPDQGFELVRSDEDLIYEKIHRYLLEHGEKSQSELVEYCQDEKIARRDKCRTLLSQGEGRYWESRKEGKKKIYRVLATCKDIHSVDKSTGGSENIIPYSGPDLTSEPENVIDAGESIRILNTAN